MINKRPRFWFLIWLLPVITVYFARSPFLKNIAGSPTVKPIPMRPAEFNMSCEICLKGNRGSITEQPNISHCESFAYQGIPSLTSFTQAPLFRDGKLTTGYPKVGAGVSSFSPVCYALYSFPTNQAISKVALYWTSTMSNSGLSCCYYYSDDGIKWTPYTLEGKPPTGTNGSIVYNVKSAAKYHLLQATYQGSPVTLSIDEAIIRNGASAVVLDPMPAKLAYPPISAP